MPYEYNLFAKKRTLRSCTVCITNLSFKGAMLGTKIKFLTCGRTLGPCYNSPQLVWVGEIQSKSVRR